MIVTTLDGLELPVGYRKTLTYAELVSEQFGLSEAVRGHPSVVIVTDVPDRQYARQFHDRVVAMPEIPYDVPGGVFSMRKAPLFIFVLDKPVSRRNTAGST